MKTVANEARWFDACFPGWNFWQVFCLNLAKKFKTNVKFLFHQTMNEFKIFLTNKTSMLSMKYDLQKLVKSFNHLL